MGKLLPIKATRNTFSKTFVTCGLFWRECKPSVIENYNTKWVSCQNMQLRTPLFFGF